MAKKRAKKIGLTNEQIDSFPSKESADKFMDDISPQTNPEFYPKIGETKEVEPKPIEVRVFPVKRDDMDSEKTTMQHMVRLTNRRYDFPKMKTITKTIVYDVNKKKITKAEYEIKD